MALERGAFKCDVIDQTQPTRGAGSSPSVWCVLCDVQETTGGPVLSPPLLTLRWVVVVESAKSLEQHPPCSATDSTISSLGRLSPALLEP